MNQQLKTTIFSELKNRWGQLPIFTSLLTVIAVLVFQQDQAANWLEYDRQAIMAGQLWRLITSHWVHWSASHLFWDLLLFGITGSLIEKNSRPVFIGIIILSSLFISCFVWFGQPQMMSYRGLSGLDSALFVFLSGWLTISGLKRKDTADVILSGFLFLFFAGKITYEAITGHSGFVDSANLFIPVPSAHLIGAIAGIIVLLLIEIRAGCSPPSPR